MSVQVHALPDEGLGNTSWLVELGDGRALAVDPPRDPSAHLARAEALGLVVSHTADTHLHADFLTGSRQLAAAGVRVLAPAGAGLEWPHRGLAPGDEVDLGGLVLRALATPGHTPEHTAYLLCDGSRPRALFSGGSLLVGSVARTDLVAPERTEEMTRALYRSLHAGILALPDDVVVHPTHGAGSFCSAAAGDRRTTTIGNERRTNPLLSAPDEDAFVARLLGSLGTYPPYFLELREVNRRGPRLLDGGPLGLGPLDAATARRLVDEGAVVVDVRPVERFAARHVAGSLSIALRPQFAPWLGWLVTRDRPLVFVCDPDQDGADLVRQCLTIGYEWLAGEVAGGVDGWAAAGGDVGRLALVGPEGVGGTVVDVRQRSEFEAGHLPGAAHVELGRLGADPASAPPGPLTLMCGHGERAATGASLLAAAGRRDVAVMVGGPGEWAAATGGRLEP